MTTFLAFLHHVAAFVLFAAVIVEFVTIKDPITVRSAQRLLRADAALGVAAVLVLVVGIARVIWFEKGADFYLHNIAFHLKMTLFVVTALLSIYPTRCFMGWRPALKRGEVPVVDAGAVRKVRTVLHIEMAGVVLILLAAAMMARGVAMFE